jgi:hypothetical protein
LLPRHKGYLRRCDNQSTGLAAPKSFQDPYQR